jgi:hypothetical protein
MIILKSEPPYCAFTRYSTSNIWIIIFNLLNKFEMAQNVKFNYNFLIATNSYSQKLLTK